MASQYDKQCEWKQSIQAKASKLHEELSAKETDMTFTPIIYTAAPIKIEEINPRRFQESGQTHVERQLKARREKEEQMKRLLWQNKKKHASKPVATNSTTFVESDSFVAADRVETRRLSTDVGVGGSTDTFFSKDGVEEEEKADEWFAGEGLVDTIERERREWDSERLRLIDCVGMQHVELAAGAKAAQTSTISIAKEFAQIIATFEERLVAVEDNVQREILSVKSVTNSLEAAVSRLVAALAETGV